jgi:phage shock protein A
MNAISNRLTVKQALRARIAELETELVNANAPKMELFARMAEMEREIETLKDANNVLRTDLAGYGQSSGLIPTV